MSEANTIKVYFIGGPADGDSEEFRSECLSDRVLIPVPTPRLGLKEAVYKVEETGSDLYLFDGYLDMGE